MCMHICRTKTAAKSFCSRLLLQKILDTQQVRASLACPTFGRGHLFCLHNSFRWTLLCRWNSTESTENKGFLFGQTCPDAGAGVGRTQPACPSAVSCPDYGTFFFFCCLGSTAWLLPNSVCQSWSYGDLKRQRTKLLLQTFACSWHMTTDGSHVSVLQLS